MSQILVLEVPDSLVQQGPHHRVPVAVGVVEQRVQVGQQGVANAQVMLGAVHQRGVGSKRGRILMLETNVRCYISSFSKALCQKLFQRG